MKHPAKCKFCGKPILPSIDESYDSVSDVFKVLPLAVCNRCADLRVKRRAIESSIERFVVPMIQCRSAMSQEQITRTREALIGLTKVYDALVAEWKGCRITKWDSAIVESIMDQPQHYSKFLGQCWKMYEDKAEVAP